MDKKYIEFIADLKKNIVQSRYVAARLVNREQLLLYFKTGKMLSEKIEAENWGTRVIEQVSEDLQKQLPGLRGFSYRNLMNMKLFYAEYQMIIILQSVTAELRLGEINPIGQSATAELTQENSEQIRPLSTTQLAAFWGITFTHHLLLINKCKSYEERMFYMLRAADEFWSVSLLQHHLEADLYVHQGKMHGCL
jgi:predicted nuclease of restriction endonuclease-like (RecB) superfamily